MKKTPDSGADRKRDAAHDSETAPLHLDKLLAHRTNQGSSLSRPDNADAVAPPADEGVTEFVRKAVKETLETPGARPVLPRQAEQLSPKAVLSLISYCYAKGIYSSREIEDQLLRDPLARAELGPDLPDDRSLSRFRRLNRQLIEDTLQRVLTEAKRKSGTWPLELQPGAATEASSQDAASPNSEARPLENEQPTTHLARQAAQDLLQRAMFIDGMTRDF